MLARTMVAAAVLLAFPSSAYAQASPHCNAGGVCKVAIDVAAGSFHSVALRSDGTVTAWGYNVQGETNVPAGLSNVVAIAAGSHHTLALKSDGRTFGAPPKILFPTESSIGMPFVHPRFPSPSTTRWQTKSSPSSNWPAKSKRRGPVAKTRMCRR